MIRLSVLSAASLLTVTLIAAQAGAQSYPEHERLQIPLGLDLYLPVPESNRLTPPKVALGRKLFFDPLLSRDETISCATCHDSKRSFTDGRAIAVGVLGRKGRRNVPTLVNRGYGSLQFWDGRSTGLEEQVLQPIENPTEMDMTVLEALEILRRDPSYVELFERAFSRSVDAEGLAQALASYVRTILSGDAPIDRYLGGARDALSVEARRGLRIFRGKGNCTVCHVGPNFTDERFHNTGVAWREGQLLDFGRFAVTAGERDRGSFKTPTLRQVAETAPYMHDGSLASLTDVVEFYDQGGNSNPYLDPELRPLRLTPEEKASLVAFLRVLSGTVQEGWPGVTYQAGSRPR